MRRRLSEHDRLVWARVAKTVRPAPGRRCEALEAPVEHAAATPSKRLKSVATPPSPGPASPRPAGPLADISHHRPARRGRFEVDARLDLHGHTQDSARSELLTFLVRQRALGARCVLVITGKGRLGAGVLRSRFLEWIAAPDVRPHLAGYARAHARHGGDGAFYVLLKAGRKGRS